MKLTTHLQLVPRSRKCNLYIHSIIRLHGVVLNSLSTGKTLPFTYVVINFYLSTNSVLRFPFARDDKWAIEDRDTKICAYVDHKHINRSCWKKNWWVRELAERLLDSLRTSVRTHETSQETMGGFSRDLIFMNFEKKKKSRENSFSFRLDMVNDDFTWHTFLRVSRQIFGGQNNFSNKRSREKLNTHFVTSTYSPQVSRFSKWLNRGTSWVHFRIFMFVNQEWPPERNGD
jgi:hypothetical protein